MKIIASLLLVFSLTACLKTRSELRGGESGIFRTAPTDRSVAGDMSQQQRAQNDSRFFEIDSDFRKLYGKIETLEKQISDLESKPAPTEGEKPAEAGKMEDIEKRLATIEEALISLDKKMTEIKSEKKSDRKQSDSKSSGPFENAEELYADGKYEQAVAAYDKYRKKNPSGKFYAEATLKMGHCFEKLEMRQDAKAFYKEVIQRFPNTQLAQKAQSSLKNI